MTDGATTSFSGTDAVVSLALPRERAVTMGMVSDLSYSVLRPKFELFTLSRITPLAFTKGPRTIAGTIVFTVIGEHPMIWLKEKISYLRNYKKLKMDELPLFDIIVTFGNEYGDSAKMILHSCTIEDESMEISQMNLFTENVIRFRAKDIEYLQSAYSSHLWTHGSHFKEDLNDFELLPHYQIDNLLDQKAYNQHKSVVDSIYAKQASPNAPADWNVDQDPVEDDFYDSPPMNSDSDQADPILGIGDEGSANHGYLPENEEEEIFAPSKTQLTINLQTNGDTKDLYIVIIKPRKNGARRKEISDGEVMNITKLNVKGAGTTKIRYEGLPVGIYGQYYAHLFQGPITEDYISMPGFFFGWADFWDGGTKDNYKKYDEAIVHDYTNWSWNNANAQKHDPILGVGRKKTVTGHALWFTNQYESSNKDIKMGKDNKDFDAWISKHGGVTVNLGTVNASTTTDPITKHNPSNEIA